MTTIGTTPSVQESTAMVPGRWHRLARRPLAVSSAAFLILVVVSSLAAPWIAPYGPQDTDFGAVLGGPTITHLIGTDSLGRDVLSRVMHAGDSAIGLVVIALLVAFVLAVPVGVLAGLIQGRVDTFTTRVGDLILSIPAIVIVLMVLTLSGQNMVAAMLAFGVIAAPGLMRVARAATLSVSAEPYIAAARIAGLTRLQIGWRHVLPRIVGPVVVNLSLVAAHALLAQTGLNFLGLGVRPPQPSWGGMIADASSVMQQQPWLLFPTGGVVALSIVALVLLGDALRDTATERWSAGSTAPDLRKHGTSVNAAPPAPVTGNIGVVSREDPLGNELLRVDELTIAFPSRIRDGGWLPVVQGVTFGISRGEAVGMVGESGCGKTMTGLALLGLLPHRAAIVGGEITADGIALSSMSNKDRASLRGSWIAFVSQEPMAALDPMFTIGSQIAEAVRFHAGCSRRDARVRTLELLDEVQIADPRNTSALFPHQVSGGMAQRVSLAIALAGRPKLLIADEPTTALDVTVQAEILRLLKEIQRDTGMALLLISHDWGVVAETVERCVVMYAGQVVEEAPIGDLVARPLHPYSKGLLACDPHVAEPSRDLVTIPGTVPPPEHWPRGCHFESRCSYASAECTISEIPLLQPVPRRVTRCLRSRLLIEGVRS